jgi:quinol monooxygenase YgiN
MSQPLVSLHPYFKVQPGKMEEVRPILQRFVERTKPEPGCRGYEFTIGGDMVFCRESYVDGNATLAHLQNVADLLGEMLKFAEVARVEVHGPAAEVEKVGAALADYGAQCFAWECGLER